HANDASGTDQNFVRMASQAARRFFHGCQRGGTARRTRSAISVTRIDDNGPHAALGSTQVFLGNHNGRSDDEVLREDGGGRCRYVTGEQREIQRASFLQATSGGRETESARQGGFGEGNFHGRRIRGADRTLTEAASDPPRDALRLRKY